jgi:hypothetical protein
MLQNKKKFGPVFQNGERVQDGVKSASETNYLTWFDDNVDYNVG